MQHYTTLQYVVIRFKFTTSTQQLVYLQPLHFKELDEQSSLSVKRYPQKFGNNS